MEPLAKLERVSIISDGCFSVFKDLQGQEEAPFAVTVEHTYPLNGGQYVKLNDGVYLCEKCMYNKGGYETFEIIFPDHDLVKFHKGNLEDHSDGCVITGEEFGVYQGKIAVMSSGRAFDEFMRRFGHLQQFLLAVK